MLELLSRATLPMLSLRDAQRNWPSVAYQLAEATRKRISQNAQRDRGTHHENLFFFTWC
jgi:hypothetical protein